MKARLNLMPWRDWRRAAALRRFQAQLVGSALVALALVLVVDQLAQARLREQLAAIASQRVQVEALEQRVQGLDDLRAQRAEIERTQTTLIDLRKGQQALPAMLAGLEQAAPAGVQLTRVHLQAGQVRLTGLAATPALVAQWVRELELLALLRDIEVRQVRSTAEGDRFELLAKLPVQWS